MEKGGDAACREGRCAEVPGAAVHKAGGRILPALPGPDHRAKDACTKGHCDRVATLALRLAQTLGLSEDAQQEIRYGSWLHDCGKIGVPEAILNAERGLTKEEFEIVMKHPEWGCEVVRKANLSKTVQDIVLYHHERYDGRDTRAG